MTQNNPFRVQALAELARTHADELARLEENARRRAERPLADRYGRPLNRFDPVVTSGGEVGRVGDVLPETGEVNVYLPETGNHVLMHGEDVELRRGRPRLNSWLLTMLETA